MKTKLLLILSFSMCGAVKSQIKFPQDSVISTGKLNNIGQTFFKYSAPKWIMVGGYQPLLKIDYPKLNRQGGVDTIKIYVHKSQIHWLNDSTAVITKRQL